MPTAHIAEVADKGERGTLRLSMKPGCGHKVDKSLGPQEVSGCGVGLCSLLRRLDSKALNQLYSASLTFPSLATVLGDFGIKVGHHSANWAPQRSHGYLPKLDGSTIYFVLLNTSHSFLLFHNVFFFPLHLTLYPPQSNYYTKQLRSRKTASDRKGFVNFF